MKRLVTRGPRWVPLPVDLVVVVAYTVVAAAVATTAGGPVRTILGLPLVLFVPGYLLLAICFPRRADAVAGTDGRSRSDRRPGRREPTWGERLGLSVGVSLAVVALLALVVGAIATAVGTREVMTGLVAVSLVGSVLAAVRRLAVPPDHRLRLPRLRPATGWRTGSASGRFDAVISLVLVLGVVGAASAMAYSVAAPERGAEYTEFAVLAENESGDLVAGGYPRSFGPGESHRLTAAVTNVEGRTVEYTLVVEVQRFAGGADASAVEQRELLRETRTVEAGATWRHHHVVDPPIAGDDLRLAYYLYEGEAPTDARADTAYRRLHLWIDVEDGSDATAALGADSATGPDRSAGR